MKRMRVAIQGEPGSFSEEAAERLLGRASILCCPSFSAVFEALRRKKVERAVIPIENTLAGPVYENYDLLLEHRFWVEAEYKLRIEHMLIAPPGVGMRDLREVHSHPLALAQCRRFFARHKTLRPVAAYDTAGSVKSIMEQGRRDAAGIAGRAAARAYGARILARNIEDDRGNFTRFLLVRRSKYSRPGANKTFIVFGTRDVAGSLFRCLAVFALRDISLAKIESRPWRGRPWEYRFYVEFLGRPDTSPGREALAHLSELTSFLRVVGCYPRGGSKS
ncbi:MAG TPA: prephenate dehydratase domain-containing protein [Candidatus Acidoferrales bacterium]|nr:prephenate dehydratase domain-containing protein [Candidatus Acidoferrales bacterium]